MAQQRLSLDGPVIAGGVHDCLSAALIERAGFGALALSGAGVAASSCGVPDLGLLSLGELVHTAHAVIASAGVPAIVDADTGFGNELNVMRTCELLAQAGAAAIVLEDQDSPKRCGHMEGKSVVDEAAFRRRIRAAANALEGTGVQLIARTDALAVHGIEAAIERANASLEAGANVTFVEAPQTIDHLDRIARDVPGPKMFNVATGGRSPSLSFDELAERGFNIVIIAGLSLMPMIRSIGDAARSVLAAGSDRPLEAFEVSPRNIFETVGLDRWLAREREAASW